MESRTKGLLTSRRSRAGRSRHGKSCRVRNQNALIAKKFSTGVHDTAIALRADLAIPPTSRPLKPRPVLAPLEHPNRDKSRHAGEIVRHTSRAEIASNSRAAFFIMPPPRSHALACEVFQKIFAGLPIWFAGTTSPSPADGRQGIAECTAENAVPAFPRRKIAPPSSARATSGQLISWRIRPTSRNCFGIHPRLLPFDWRRREQLISGKRSL